MEALPAILAPSNGPGAQLRGTGTRRQDAITDRLGRAVRCQLPRLVKRAQLGIAERPSDKAEIADRDDLVRETEDRERGLYAVLIRSDPDRADHEEQDPDESQGCDQRNVKNYASASPE